MYTGKNKCEWCGGNGAVWADDQDGNPTTRTQPCDVCNGTGKGSVALSISCGKRIGALGTITGKESKTERLEILGKIAKIMGIGKAFQELMRKSTVSRCAGEA